jgi:integrative and conjugative element protein (TIGR02256 family)
MDHLEWSSADGNYTMSVPAEAWQNIVRETRKKRDTETGGILIGHYADGHTAVVRQVTTAPGDSKSGFSWFLRGVAGLRTLLTRLWDQEDRQYYLGEWHYHPAARLVPSGEDIEQMQQISRSSRYSCLEPIMLLVGLESQGNVPSRAFVFPKGVMTELNRILAQ